MKKKSKPRLKCLLIVSQKFSVYQHRRKNNRKLSTLAEILKSYNKKYMFILTFAKFGNVYT